MTPAQFAQLVLLAAIWGASFLFMRIAVPQIGPSWLLEIRLFSAALALLVMAQWIREPLRVKRYWKHYLFLGCFNTAIPFFTMAWAASTLPASVLSVINATAPLCGLVVGFLWRGKPIGWQAALGLMCGMAGVATIAGVGGSEIGADQLTAVVVCLLAPVCYGIASSYAEYAERVPAFANAHGSLWASVALIVPLMFVAPVPTSWPASAVAAGIALGVVCSGMAYLLYFHLVSTVGAASALTVGYLIPLFGVTWGWLFLGEPVGWNTFGGAALVLTGTALVTGMNPRRFLRRRPRLDDSPSGQA
ncbi:MAG: DMT family transporter [Halieaceae bacterium]|nr:DMT family transporter [Halieaceae bacterium]